MLTITFKERLLLKLLLLLFLLSINLIAAENNQSSEALDDALGAIFSIGEGKGVLYRVYGDDSYIEHSTFAFLVSDDEYQFASLMYGLSYGKYLYTPPASKYHFKYIAGLELNFEYDSDSWQHSLKTKRRLVSMLSGGFGLEWGRKEHDTIIFGADLFYLLRATTTGEYRVMPSFGFYTLYNF